MNEGEESSLEPVRLAFNAELEQLRLQVEVMALKVDLGLQQAVTVLQTGDPRLAQEVIVGDDDIDAMLVSLTGRCYDLLCRQSPVASDLRLIVSVLRIVSDLERTGDLCLRIVKLAPDQPLVAGNPETFEILMQMGREAQNLFRLANRAFSTQDLALAKSLEQRDDAMDAYNVSLMEALMLLEGPEAVPLAIKTLLAGRALERIADHSVIVGERLGYILTGDVESLAREVNPRRN